MLIVSSQLYFLKSEHLTRRKHADPKLNDFHNFSYFKGIFK